MIDSTDRQRRAETADPRFRDDPHYVEPRRTADSAAGIGTLLKELRDETTLLVRQEIALARTEMSERISKIGRNAAYLASGTQVAFAGLIFVLLAITAGIYVAFVAADMEYHGMWIAPLIVGCVVSLIGLMLVMKGKNAIQSTSPLPERTIETMKENKEWIREKV
ncbi:phage holin family protein [Candidatus Laterigemmans baculatus]|uniref:phage holin family protein n=1 Tax=Candidatus Laterigemmans baculatus TaxID=2770505 RepID=UPI0013DD38B3|nr:phage holin family protein [Candidatus Laterigemmans baculatus]